MEIRFLHSIEIGGRMCERFPVISSEADGVLMGPMRYLIQCFEKGASFRSLETYAGHLRDLHEQLSVDDRSVQSITSTYLEAYKSEIAGRSSHVYAAQVLRTVLHYLLHQEDAGAVVGVIGESEAHAISISRTQKGGITHALMKGATSPKSNHYPSEKAIGTIKEFGPLDASLGERFELMIDWCHVKGLRAKEVCGLVVSDIPDEPSIVKALTDGRQLDVRLTVTKGSKARVIQVPAMLLLRTRKWMDTYRRQLVRIAHNKARYRGETFREPQALFLSRDAQGAITRKALSNAVRRAFLAAVARGDLTMQERTWLHGLRKTMINRENAARPRVEGNLAEHELRRETGHGSLDSLGRYVVVQP